MWNFLSLCESKTLGIHSPGQHLADTQLPVMSNRKTHDALSAFGKLNHLAALPLRLVVGYGFIAHGYAKLARGPEHFINILSALRVPAPAVMAWITIGTELVGGSALLAGAFVTFVSVPLAAILLVAALTVHVQYGFSSIKLQAVTAAGAQFGQPGYELDLLYLACLLTLMLGGSGPLSIDNLFRRGEHARNPGTSV